MNNPYLNKPHYRIRISTHHKESGWSEAYLAWDSRAGARALELARLELLAKLSEDETAYYASELNSLEVPPYN